MTGRLLHVVARVGQLALWALLLGFVVLVAIPRFTPFDVLVVRGGSMEPRIPLGSIVVVDRGSRVPVIGSVSSFRDSESGIVTHRVVAMIGERYVTKGDANQADDPIRRTATDVYGTVVLSMPLAGYLIRALQQPPVFLVLLIGTGGLLVISAIRTIVGEVARIRFERGRADVD